MENIGRLARLSKFVGQRTALIRNHISGTCEYCPPSKSIQETPRRPCGGGLIAAPPSAMDSSARLAPRRSRRFVFALISICIFGGSSPVMADDPSLQNLPPSDYSLLQSAVTSIKEATGLDDQVKSVLLSAVSQAANMAYSPYLQKFVLEKFALDSQLVFKGIVADPLSYAKDAAKGAGKDMLKGMAIDIAGAMAADAIFSVRPLADLPPKWEVPMHAMVHATVSELINLGASSVEPSEAVTGTAERVYDLYRIYKASVGLAHVQDEVVVQTAIGLEISARLVTLNPSAKNNELARSTISDAVDNLDQAFGTGYNQALTEIVNLTFVGLLSDLRGDKTRASAMVERIRAAGKLGVDDGLPTVLENPVEWIAATVRLSDDPPSRTAALMISSTILADLNKADQVVAAPGTPEIAAATPQDRWGPDIVPQIDVGYMPCGGQRKTDDRCLRELGLSQAAIAFSFEVGGDYSGLAVANSFRDLGAVDLAVALFQGANSWYEPVLLNGPLELVTIQQTADLRATFSDPESRNLLGKFPNAASFATGYYTPVSSHRTLADGTQRFAMIEMVTEGCHACQPIGSAVTFLDIGPATGGKLLRRPIGIGLDPSLPGMDREVTPQVLMATPAFLQLYLNKLGYDAGSMDGFPGPQTRQALMEFQVEHCLPPTGQLNDGTASALVPADGFAAPCADARLPPGIYANTPLLSGVYVDSPEKCQNPSTVDTMSSLWIISDGSKYQIAGFDNTCVLKRTDMKKGMTKFSAQCTVEGSPWGPSDWIADLKGVDKFTVWYGDAVGQSQSFTRCADDSAAAKEFFGQPLEMPALHVETLTSPSTTPLPLIGQTADLFNLLGSQLENPCSAPCAVSGTAGQYLFTPFTASGISAQDILATNDLHYEQGIPRMLPPGYSEGYPPIDQLDKYRLWFVSRTDCEPSTCPKALVALLPKAIANYHGDFGYSGPAGRLLDVRQGFQIPEQAAQTADSHTLPENGAEIRAYCATQGDAAGPGEAGSHDPEIVAAGGSTWRCMDGKVLVCYLGASGRGCLQTAAPTAQQMSELENFCRKNAGSNMIPARLMTGLATQWHCSGTNPTVESASSVDRLGYFTKAWHALGQSTAQETTAAVATGGAGLLGEYESTPEPSELACTGIGHPLRVRPDGIDFYESVCTFAAPIPAGATEHASNVVCAGEGSTWSDRMFLKLLSDDLVSIASGQAPDGFVYRRCQGVADGSAQSEGPAPQAQPASADLDLASATAPELAALLRAFGIKSENIGFVSGDISSQQKEMNRLIEEYQNHSPLVVTPDLPIAGRYDSQKGTFSACIAENVYFPVDLVRGAQGYGDDYDSASLKIALSDPITDIFSLPQICIIDMSEANKMEALHGTGELERFGLENPRGFFVRFKMSPSDAVIFSAAVETGQARVSVECEMKTMVLEPYTAVPYNYEKIGTCVPKRFTLKAIDFETGNSRIVNFSAGGSVFSPTSGVISVISTEPKPSPQAQSDQMERAKWSFATDKTGEEAVREIVQGFEGTTAEILLGYENAFPFQTSSAQKLAVAVFHALPKEQIATRSGTELGYGSFILKSWSDLNDFYFINGETGTALAVIGTIDGVRILSVSELAASSCEWDVTYRIWLRDMTPFGEALAATSKSDGYTFKSCFRVTREGYDILYYSYVDG